MRGEARGRCVRGALFVTLAALASSGCFSEILVPPPTTVLEFTCHVLDQTVSETVVLESWGSGPGSREAVEALRSELVRVTGRFSASMTVSSRDAANPPGSAWEPEEVPEWARERTFSDGNAVVFRILWVDSLGGNMTGASGAGTVAVAADAVAGVAARLNVTVGDAARVLLFHHAGHALGVVNRGIPVQDPTIQEREGPPGHEPDPASVLDGGWEDVRTADWAPGATYEGYSDGVRGDWAGAVAPGGVCT